jgi:hypothetical protein
MLNKRQVKKQRRRTHISDSFVFGLACRCKKKCNQFLVEGVDMKWDIRLYVSYNDSPGVKDRQLYFVSQYASIYVAWIIGAS